MFLILHVVVEEAEVLEATNEGIEIATPEDIPVHLDLTATINKVMTFSLHSSEKTGGAARRSHNLIYRVHVVPGKPRKSWNVIVGLSRTGKSWKKATGPEHLLNSSKKYEVYGRH